MYLYKSTLIYTTAALAGFSGIAPNQTIQAKSKNEKPNLVFIMTDQHSYLTLGCYRKFLPDELAYRWGKDAMPSTKNLDRLADEGAIYTSYYSSAPVSSPSRSSIFTGNYPAKTGVPLNGCGLRHDMTSIAQVLNSQGYVSDYVGKWHCADNEPIPGWGVTPSFGFENKYMFNTGHQKYFVVNPKDTTVELLTNNPRKVPGKMVVHSTKFLTDRAMEFIEDNHDRPFCLVLSIPDPHTPEIAVPPYDKMYENIKCHPPLTMKQKAEDRPEWSKFELDNELESNFDSSMNSEDAFSKERMVNYFGMVTDVDDNVGRILALLKKYNIEDNTIVVYTSDHGELNFEHHRINKGLPYETSSRVPCIIRYPKVISKRKVISTPTVNVDLMPTLIDLMGLNLTTTMPVDGVSDAKDLVSKKKKVTSDRTIYTTSTFNWVMAVDSKCKLVLSTNDEPWLYDLKKDPLEMVNEFHNPEYAEEAAKLMKELKRQMTKYQEPRLNDVLNPLRFE